MGALLLQLLVFLFIALYVFRSKAEVIDDKLREKFKVFQHARTWLK